MLSIVNGMSQRELRQHVRKELQALIVEKRYLTMQLKSVVDRLDELEKAEVLLEGEF
jgi:hypothetical protein